MSCAFVYVAAAAAMQAVQPMLPPWLFKLLSTAIRLVNNVVGGMSFVRTASFAPLEIIAGAGMQWVLLVWRHGLIMSFVQVTLAKMLKVQESSTSPASHSEL